MYSRNSVISVVGGEIAGDKAAALAEHETLIYEAGCEIPPTTVIASETIDPLKRNLEPSLISTYYRHFDNIVHRYHGNIVQIASKVCEAYAGSPVLAVRSSAEGDAAGTGVYRSDFADSNDAGDVEWAISRVVSGFHDRGAADFREQTGLGNKFAVMIQPTIGQVLERRKGFKLFGPALSGVGYSAMRGYPDGVISVVAGLGGGVDRPGGELVTPATARDVRQLAENYRQLRAGDDMSFFDYVAAARKGQKRSKIEKAETDFRANPRAGTLKQIAGLTFMLDQKGDTISSTPDMFQLELGRGIHLGKSGETDDNPLMRAMRLFNPEKMLESLQAMQQTAGYPLYVEWAWGLEGNEAQPYILQIAPHEITDQAAIETQPLKNPFITARNIHGHGVKKSNKLIFLPSRDAIPDLAAFNGDPENAGYILVYSARVTSCHRGTLQFKDISNAGTVIETNGKVHCDPMLSHIGGVVSKTGKFYGQVHERKSRLSMKLGMLARLNRARQISSSPHGMEVLGGDFEVHADEMTGQLTVGIVK